MNMWLIVVFSLRISHPIGLVDNKISARIVAFCVAFLFVRDSASFFEKRNFVFRDAARSCFSEVPFFGPSFLGKAVWTASDPPDATADTLQSRYSSTDPSGLLPQ